MSLGAEIDACARVVERGDPVRFRTAMAAPPAARRVLFPLYAFNVEVARAPWVTGEAMIAEMRLQWWRDVLEEVATGGPVRRHEVATPLGAVLTPDLARMLDAAVAARRWDIYRDPFEGPAHMAGYLNETAGHLMWAAAQILGAPAGQEAAVRSVAGCAALVAYLSAVPALEAQGRIPLLDGTRDGVAALARATVQAVRRPALPAAARPALWPALGAARTLRRVAADPGCVAAGAVPAAVPPHLLTWAALTGRVPL